MHRRASGRASGGLHGSATETAPGRATAPGPATAPGRATAPGPATAPAGPKPRAGPASAPAPAQAARCLAMASTTRRASSSIPQIRPDFRLVSQGNPIT